MEMMAANLAGAGLHVVPGSGEDPLPGPLATGVRVLASKGKGKLHPPGAPRKIRLVLPMHNFELPLHCLLDSRREQGDPVLVSLPTSHGDLARIEIEVLDPQPEPLAKPQPSAVQESGHQPRPALQLAQNR